MKLQISILIATFALSVAHAAPVVSPAAAKVQTFIATTGVAGINSSTAVEKALQASEKAVGKAKFEKTMKATADAIEAIEKATDEVRGIKKDTAKKAIEGLVAVQTLLGDILSGSSKLSSDKQQLVQSAAKALAFGNVAEFLAGKGEKATSKTWTQQSIEGLGNMLAKFSDMNLKGASDAAIANSFVEAVEAHLEATKNNMDVNAFLKALAEKCA